MFADLFLAPLVLFVIVASRFGARLQDVAGAIATRTNLRVVVYVILFDLVLAAVRLPLDVWGGYLREKSYGFMNQDFAAWLGDHGKMVLLSIGVQVLFVPLMYLLIRRFGRVWWIPGAAAAIALVIIGQVVVPVFIAPLFNDFSPLRDSALKKEILDLAHSKGIPADEVYEVDASRQSEHTNAYAAGLLGTERIVLYDTLLTRYAPREILFVMGHEMGHYVLRHIWKTVGFLSLLIAGGFLLADRIARRLIASHPRWRIGALDQPASLPLFVMIVSLLLIPLQPVISAYSRAQEHAADRFGLEVTRDPEAAASSFLKFGRYDLSELEVNPVVEFLLFSHPSTGHRIRYAQDWARRHGTGAAIPGR